MFARFILTDVTQEENPNANILFFFPLKNAHTSENSSALN